MPLTHRWSPEQARAYGCQGRATQSRRAAEARELLAAAAKLRADPHGQMVTRVHDVIDACLRCLPASLGTVRGERIARTLESLLGAEKVLVQRTRGAQGTTHSAAQYALLDSLDMPASLP